MPGKVKDVQLIDDRPEYTDRVFLIHLRRAISVVSFSVKQAQDSADLLDLLQRRELRFNECLSIERFPESVQSASLTVECLLDRVNRYREW